jgi:hypothetical protein
VDRLHHRTPGSGRSFAQAHQETVTASEGFVGVASLRQCGAAGGDAVMASREVDQERRVVDLPNTPTV